MCKPELTEEEFSKNITPIVQVRPQVLVNSTILSIVCNAIYDTVCLVLSRNTLSMVKLRMSW